jgi:hypothetical protein
VQLASSGRAVYAERQRVTCHQMRTAAAPGWTCTDCSCHPVQHCPQALDQFLREALEAALLAPAAAAVEADLRLALFAADAAATAVSSDSSAEAAAAAQGGQAAVDATAEARWVVQLATLPPLRLGTSTLDIRSASKTVVAPNGQDDPLALSHCSRTSIAA